MNKENRIIKFRAWDPKESRMIGNADLCLIEYCDKEEMKANILTGIGIDKLNCIHADLILMQFAGLYDKNGKEIYDGDIVRYKYHTEHLNYDQVSIISWKSTGFHIEPITGGLSAWLVAIPGGYMSEFDNNKNELFELIGNIHENKESLRSN